MAICENHRVDKKDTPRVKIIIYDMIHLFCIFEKDSWGAADC